MTAEAMRISVLSSGSKGNITHIEADGQRVLVDIGLSCKQTELRMEQAGLDASQVSAILVTHEHSDHIRGISVFSRRYHVPVYISQTAWQKVWCDSLNWYEVRSFDPDESLHFGSLCVCPVRIPHDTSDPLAYTFENGGKKFGMATDLGSVPENVFDALSGSNALLIESNHDERMLQNGPYPWVLKKRISGPKGHLSNRQSSNLLKRLLHPGLKKVILGHLSEENNTPELASSAAMQIINGSGNGVMLEVADQYRPGETFILK